MLTRNFDVAVLGGSLGGVQAARAACECGLHVYLCEATDWLGGQMTSQAVPPDEHRWINIQGATASYMAYRHSIREHFLQDPAAAEAMRAQGDFIPGNAWVSRLAHDPRVSERYFRASLAPFVEQGLLTIAYSTRLLSAQVQGDRVLSVLTANEKGEQECIAARFFLDATDTGELLPLTGTEYRIGAESREETGEPNAPEKGDREDQQPITWVGALRLYSERPEMKKPESYDYFASLSVRGLPLFSWEAYGAGGVTRFGMFDGDVAPGSLGMWSYRRIQYPPFFTDKRSEISLLNWQQNDYMFGNIIDDPQSAHHLEMARKQTKCCAYWLWSQGYPVALDGEMLGTSDGLAKAPYIRESRRIIAKRTILEQEIAKKWNPVPRVRRDSVGVGHYSLDVHLTTRTRTTFYEEAQPFEIPLSAMIPVRMLNLLPAGKNIGTTHLTGGCFRLHPVEWTVGEAAGYLAAFCVHHALLPRDVLEKPLDDFQSLLISRGFQLHWDFPEEKDPLQED